MSDERQLLEAIRKSPDAKLIADFQDTDELVRLGLNLALKRVLVLVHNSETAPTHVITGARLFAQVAGKMTAGGEDDPDSAFGKGLREKDVATLKSAIERTKKL